MIGPMKTTILRRLTASALSAHSRLTRTQLPVRNAFSENALSQLTHASGTTDSHVTTRFTPSLSPAPRDKQERDEWDQSDADFSTRAESQLADFVRPGRFASWVGRYRPLLQAKGFGRALLSTIKNERSMEQENRTIGRLQFPVTFFWGELDNFFF